MKINQFLILLLMIFSLSAFAEDPPPPPQDVNVKNTPDVKIVNEKIQVDLGEVTPVEAPVLPVEDIPTAQIIFKPIYDWWVTSTTYRIPSHYAICPQSEITLFQKRLYLNAHCTVLDNARLPLQQAMLFGFMVAAIFIIFSS